MSQPKVQVSKRQTIHVITYCEGPDCGFENEWNPPESKLAEAKRHVRETGHMVALDETRISNIIRLPAPEEV